jgi:hypothetical protein
MNTKKIKNSTGDWGRFPPKRACFDIAEVWWFTARPTGRTFNEASACDLWRKMRGPVRWIWVFLVQQSLKGKVNP